MADKIANFEDYKKRDNVEDTDVDIQIEDPYNFFNEQEREEYFQERQKELAREEKAANKSEELHQEEKNKNEAPEHSRPARHRDDPEDTEYDEDYEDEEYDEDEDDNELSSGFPIELFIRISSIITGIIILLFLAIVAKVKIYDRYLAPDPDEAAQTVVALPSGYTEKNDTVVVTAESLNLRSVDNSESNSTVVTSVSKGTELKRIAVNEAGTWALVEYDNNRLYASMKYLQIKE